MSSVQEEDKSKQTREVDLGAAGRGVWLVKVPKYLSEKWKKASGKCEVGKLKITRSKMPGTKPEVSFSTNDSQSQQQQQVGGKSMVTPRDHNFLLTGVGNQNLVVFSETKDTKAGASAEALTERIAIEGKVIQRAECRPVADSSYLKLKKQQMVFSNQPRREIKQIDTVVQSYKPVSVHPTSRLEQKKQKEEGKRIRDDKEVVMNKLFAVFEKHQYYNIQDLVRLTNQPITYLKEILKEICVYNVKAPHKNMWELKPEYRHYKEQK